MPRPPGYPADHGRMLAHRAAESTDYDQPYGKVAVHDAMPTAAATIEGPTPRKASLASDAATLALGSLFTQAAQILTLSVLARLVAKDQLATYQQMNLIYGIVSPLLLAGVPAALLYFVPRAALDDERRAWVARAYIVLGTMGLVASAAVVAMRHPLAALLGNDRLAEALLWYAPFMFFAFVAAVAPPALVATGHARNAAIVNGLVGCATLICVVVAAIVSPTGKSLAVALSASGALLAVTSTLMVRRAIGVRLAGMRGKEGDARRLLSYGLPLAATGLAGTLGYQFDRIVVSVTSTPSKFAIYALGAVEVPVGLLIAAAISNVLAPRLTVLWRDGDRATMIRLWREAMRKASLVLLPLFAFLMVMSTDVVRVLYGSGFSESIDVFRIYLFLLPLRITTWGLIPQAIGRTRINLWASVLIVVVNAVVAITLIGPLGLVGPALAAPLSAVAAAGYYIVRLRSIAGLTARDLLPLSNLASTLAVAGVAALPLLAVREIAAPSSIRVLIAALVFGVVAPLALRATRRISDDDLQRLRAVVGVRYGRAPRRA
jgi:O-antigen/teichoic acid export membrane protein